MTLPEQAAARVASARHLGREPVRWIATAAVLDVLLAEAPSAMWDADGKLLGLPIAPGEPRSEWGLQLITALPAALAA